MIARREFQQVVRSPRSAQVSPDARRARPFRSDDRLQEDEHHIVECPKCKAKSMFDRTCRIDSSGFGSYSIECKECGAHLAGIVDPNDETLLLSETMQRGESGQDRYPTGTEPNSPRRCSAPAQKGMRAQRSDAGAVEDNCSHCGLGTRHGGHDDRRNGFRASRRLRTWSRNPPWWLRPCPW
jgi:hypothetical protein